MNTEARDPILRGLDELAGLADADQRGDRMVGITRRARTNRIRRGAAGAVCLAVVAGGTAYALQARPDHSTNGDPGIATRTTDSPAPTQDPEQVYTDEVSVDIDGDGLADRIRLVLPQPDTSQGGTGAYAEVTRASGETAEIPLGGRGTPEVAGTADLNGDGVHEVQIRSEGEHHDWWSVLTFTGGQVVAATPILSGSEWITEPETGAMAHEYAGETYRDFQVTWVRGDQLVTWFAGRAWDQESPAEVRLFPWGLDGGELSLGGQVETVCVTADQATWTDPEPC